MLSDIRFCQTYLARNLHEPIQSTNDMTFREVRAWVDETSSLIRRELGKHADGESPEEEPPEHWQ